MRRVKDLLRGGRSLLPRADRQIGDQRTSSDVASSALRSPSESDPPDPSTSDPSPRFSDGIKVWHDCPDATIDICFVHGLTGNRDSTWTWSKQSKPWPPTLLPPKLPRARLLTWGYDAYVVQASVAAKNRLTDHAMNLLIDLTNDRASCDASGRPLIFVAHSLGGLVCKEAILLSRNNPEPHLCNVFKHTTGIIFMGTPHRGAWIADWMKIPASGLGFLKSTNKSLLQVLGTDDQLLESIQVKFWSMVREQRESGRRLEITCFFEELPLPVVGKVVSKVSATIEGYTSVSVHANHRDMVQFRTENDNGFKRLVGDLMRWAPSLPTGQVIPASKEVLVAGTSGACSDAIFRPRYYLPFRKNRHFVGRSTVLEALEKMLFIEQSETVALVGLGGIGKTQVALQFAYSVKANKQEYSIFWVAALSEASFEKAYAELAYQLGVKKSKEDEDVKDLVHYHLCSEKAGKWLLIVDNADDMEVVIGSKGKHGIYQYLPNSESGRVVFTTRSREVAVAVAGSDIIDLREMTQEEATAFVKTSLTRKELLQNEETIVELLRELTYLPLAIVQAVAYLNQNQISVRKYLGLLRGTEQSKLSLLSRGFHDRTRYEGLQNAVATTWLVSFAQIRRSDKAAASILGFVSCIEPKAIPRSILPEVEPEEEMEHAIGTLRGYAFLSQGGDEEMFDMHSLVHVATWVWLESEGLTEQTTIDAIRHIEKIFPHSDRTSREKWRGYVPHALRVLNRSSCCEIAERYDLFMTVGSCLYLERRFKEAIRCFEVASEWRKEHFTKGDLSRLASEHALASAYLGDRRIKEAIKILEHVVAVQKRTLADEDHYRLTSEHELASAYLGDRRIKEAIEILEHVVAVRKRTLADEDHSRLASEHALASAYLDDRRIKEAIKILEHVVAVQKRTLADEDHFRLASEHELASAYLGDRRIKEAIKILEHVVAVRKRTLADEDHSRLTSEHALASAYLGDRRIKEAIEILEHVVAVRKRTLADEDHSRLTSEHVLASAYLGDRRIKEAIKILEHVVAVQKRTLADEDHSRLASDLALASAYLGDRRIKEAIKILEHVVAVQKRTLADEDHSRLASEHVLASAYLGDRQIKEAIEILEHVVAVRKRTLADEDHSRLASGHELARAYLGDRRIKEAIEILEYVVAVRKRTLADEDHSRLTSEHVLASAYLDNKMVEEAIQLLEHIVAVEEHLFEEDDPDRHVSLDLLTDAYTRLESGSRPD